MIDDPPKTTNLAPAPPDDSGPRRRVPLDLDEAEKLDSEEKVKVTGWAYLKRLIKPVSAEDRRVYVTLMAYVKPYWRKAVLAILLSMIGGSLTIFQLGFIQAGVAAIAPAEQKKPGEPDVGPIAKMKAFFQKLRGSDPAAPATPADPVAPAPPVVAPPDPPKEPTKSERLDVLQQVVLSIVLLYAVASLLKYTREVMMASVSRKMIRDLRQDCFKNLVRLPLYFHQSQHSSRVLSRLTKDITRLRQMLISVSLGFATEIFVFLACLGFALITLGWIAILLFVFVAAAFVPIRIIGDRLRYRDKQAEAGEADLFAIISEAIMGQKIVKAFTAEKHEIRRFRDTARAMYRRQMETYKLRASTEPIVDFIAGVSIAVGVWILGGMVLDNQLEVGALTAVLMAMQRLNRSVAHLGKHQNDFVRGMTAGERIIQILDQVPEVPDAKDAVPLERFVGKIEYDGVKFSYVRGSRALRGITLTIKKGETVAIVGPSGAGKTSIVDMLPRFYEPDKGVIRIDGIELGKYTLNSLRQMIGIVSQETILFSGTIAENISYGVDGVTREQVIGAARDACAHDFIITKDEGYDTELGERGGSLSGGERQRLAIARAILKNPPILILDEATAALDAESEAHVQQALDNLMTGRTTIVIAHRLATVKRANHIVVVQRGEIVEEGEHAALMAKDGLYAKAYNLQMEAMLRGESKSSFDRFFRADE